MSTVAHQQWDAWLEGLGTAVGFAQTSAWGDMSAAATGAAWHVVSVDATAGALLTVQPRRGRARLHRPTAVSMEGPALGPGDPAAALDALLAAVADDARSRGVGTVRFDAPPPLAPWVHESAIDDVFRLHGYLTTQWATAVVDLDADDEELMRRFDKAARKSVRRVLDAGLVVEAISDLDAYRLTFRPAYLEARTASGLGGLPPGDVDAMRFGIGTTHMFFVAREDDVVLGTLGSYRFHGIATEITSAITPAGHASGHAVQDLLHWELFRYHRSVGDCWFNLAGFNPEPSSDKETGISRYKRKWGGQVVPSPMRAVRIGRLG